MATLEAALGRLGSGDPPLRLADLDLDGTLDVVVSGWLETSPPLVGAIFVWMGGPGIGSGTGPGAILTPSSPVGIGPSGETWFADLTGDGYLDLLSGRSAASGGYGKFFLWAGGPALGGTHFPLATLSASLQGDGDLLGTLSGQSLHIADLTGDGALDVVSGSWWADTGPPVDTGRLSIWGGADGFGPGSSAELGVFADPSAEAGDRLGDF